MMTACPGVFPIQEVLRGSIEQQLQARSGLPMAYYCVPAVSSATPGVAARSVRQSDITVDPGGVVVGDGGGAQR